MLVAGSIALLLSAWHPSANASEVTGQFKTLREIQQESARDRALQSPHNGGDNVLNVSIAAPRPVPCPDPQAADLFNHYIAYQGTEESDPLKGVPLIHVNVWMRGSLTGFYVRGRLKGAVPPMRVA